MHRGAEVHHRRAPRGGHHRQAVRGEVPSPCLHLQLPFMHHVKHTHELSSFITQSSHLHRGSKAHCQANIYYKHWLWPTEGLHHEYHEGQAPDTLLDLPPSPS